MAWGISQQTTDPEDTAATNEVDTQSEITRLAEIDETDLEGSDRDYQIINDNSLGTFCENDNNQQMTDANFPDYSDVVCDNSASEAQDGMNEYFVAHKKKKK